MFKYKDTYFAIVDSSKLYLLIYDELIKVIPKQQADYLMKSLGYDNDMFVYSLRNCAQIVRELENGPFVVSFQLVPNLPPYKDFYTTKNVAGYITEDQYNLGCLLHDNVINQDEFNLLKFKQININ